MWRATHSKATLHSFAKALTRPRAAWHLCLWSHRGDETMSDARPRSRQKKPALARTTEGVVPIVQEELVVGKQTQETGKVVVQVSPQVRQQRVEIALAREDVQVERIPVNRPVDATQPPRQEGNV